MFLQFKKLNNRSGVVLFVVLMSAIIIMIYSFSILGQGINEIDYAQQQIDQIESQEWSKGVFWNAYSQNFTLGNFSNSITLQNRTYTATVNYITTTQAATVNTAYVAFQ